MDLVLIRSDTLALKNLNTQTFLSPCYLLLEKKTINYNIFFVFSRV